MLTLRFPFRNAARDACLAQDADTTTRFETPPLLAYGTLAVLVTATISTFGGCAHGDASQPRADVYYLAHANDPPSAQLLSRDGGVDAIIIASSPTNPVAAAYRADSFEAVGAPVVPEVPAPTTNALRSATPSDAMIEAQVRDAILHDALLSERPLSVQVVSRDGVVILRGHAASDAEKRRILNHARAVPGVEDVVDVLAVDR